MRRLLLAALLLAARVAYAGMPIAGTGPNLPTVIQTGAVEIISAVAQCTGTGQPFSCCTGSGTGSGCDVTAASTDALPTWDTVYTGGAGAVAMCVASGSPFACCTGAGAGSNCPTGSKVTGLWLTSTDATAHVVTCTINKNGKRGGGIAITTSTVLPGFANAAPAINLLTAANWPGLPVDSDGNPFLTLASSSDKVDCRYTTAITSGKLLGITATGADF
jgi:hypothetical protein